MKIERLRNKVKIMLEHNLRSYGNLNFGILRKEDLDKLVINVFLHNGTRISHEDIEQITFKVRDEKK